MDNLSSWMTAAIFKNWLTAGTGAVGLAWYYLCIFDLGLRPTEKDKQASSFRQFESLSLTTISVSLATYVGYVVGLPSNGAQVSANGQGIISSLQLASAVLYVLSLAIAVVFYYRTQDATEPALVGLAKSLLGFVAGVFSVTLNIPKA